MNRHEKIRSAYKSLGGEATFYDGMVTCTTPLGKLVSAVVWNMGKTRSARYIETALAGIPEDFSGEMLDVPVGTGVLTMPVYQTIPQAQITCLDYSPDMMAAAKKRAEGLGVSNVTFVQGDVGQLPFEDGTFDLVLSMSGFHAFPDKEAAYAETYRVLKPGGTFCGCFYIQGQNRRTDWFMGRVYTPMGYFTPPFETLDSLRARLKTMYTEGTLTAVGSMACFRCIKQQDAP